ncbi:MAG: hypothetical protein J3Q66DRAFT_343721 [Benniella sp.]|nr:MAG: hypothetical protein J3Q66DRAFT_343721 [Benniella sp.]
MEAQGDPLGWDTETTARWLQATFDFSEETVQRFRDNDIDGSILLNNVDHEVLKNELGITSFGLRCNILSSFRSLQYEYKSEDDGIKYESEGTPAWRHERRSLTDPLRVQSRYHFANRGYLVHPAGDSEEIPLFKTPLQVWRAIPHDPSHTTSRADLAAGQPIHQDVDEILLIDDLDIDNGGHDDIPAPVKSTPSVDIGDIITSNHGMIDTSTPESQLPLIQQTLAPQERVATPPSALRTTLSKRVAPTLIPAGSLTRTLNQESPSRISTASPPMVSSAHVLKGTAPVPQDLEPANRSSPSKRGTTGRPHSSKAHQHYCPHAGLNLRELFFSQGRSELRSDDDDDWSMPSLNFPKKSVPASYKRVIQTKLKRILRTPPIIDATLGRKVYAPMKRQEKDVPVRLLSTSGVGNDVIISTSTWDAVFKGGNGSSLRVKVDVDKQDLSSINFKALTGGDVPSPVNQGPESDSILPLYGESDASAYTTDEELYRQVEKEENERLNKSNVRPVKAQAMIGNDLKRDIITEHMNEHRSNWTELHVPRLDKSRSQTYRGLMQHSDSVNPVDSLKEHIKQLSEKRVVSLVRALIETPFKSKDEVRKACKSLDETFAQLWESQWRLDLVQGPAPPPDVNTEDSLGPKVTQTTSMASHPRRERVEQELSSDDEDLRAEMRRQQELDDAFIDDTGFHTANDDSFEYDAEEDTVMVDHSATKQQKTRSSDHDNRSLSLPSPTSIANSSQSEGYSSGAEDMDNADRRHVARRRKKYKTSAKDHGAKSSTAKRQPSLSDSDDTRRPRKRLTRMRSRSHSPEYINISEDESPTLERSADIPPVVKTEADVKVQSIIRPGSSDEESSVKEPLKGDSHDNPMDVDESVSSGEESSSGFTDAEDPEESQVRTIKPMNTPNWREQLRDDDALMRELRRVRKSIALGLKEASMEPLISAWQEYIESIELDCEDSISFRKFLMWKDQGQNTVTHRARVEAAAAIERSDARKKRQEGRRLRALEKMKRQEHKAQAKKDKARQEASSKTQQLPNDSPSKRSQEATAMESDEGVDEDLDLGPTTGPKNSSKSVGKGRTSIARRRIISEESSSNEATVSANESARGRARSTGSKSPMSHREGSSKGEGATSTVAKANNFKFMNRPRIIRNHFGDTTDESSGSKDVEVMESSSEKPPRTRKVRPMREEGEDTLRLRKDAARNEKELSVRIEDQERRAKLRVTGPLRDDEVLINPGHKKTQHPVVIPSFLAEKLKPHQLEGVRFMWKNIVMFNGGCILAHSMGLGKTFQVIAFLFVLLRELEAGNKDIPERIQAGRVLLLMPPIVLQNWEDEFNKWIPEEERHVIQLRKIMATTNNNNNTGKGSRVRLIQEWHREGGVILLGYSLFRDFCMGKGTQAPFDAKEMLQQGASLVIADEGHLLKNITGKLTLAVNRIETASRIILTGYPLQNRLEEYYCMVDFVRPKFLGDYSEFRNNYVRPILAGLYPDSTPSEIKTSAKLLKVVTELIKNFVMRKDQSVLKLALPPKTEYVISCGLSTLQYFLYNAFLAKIDPTSKAVLGYGHILLTICNHPAAFKASWNGNLKRRKPKSSIAEEIMNLSTDLPKAAASGVAGEESDDELLVQEEIEEAQKVLSQHQDIFSEQWEGTKFQELNVNDISHSKKIMILMDILTECRAINEKVLVFTRSIPTFDYISFVAENAGFRLMQLDGSTPMGDRQGMINVFNESADYDVFLISSGAGSQGVNLVSASRVVIYDVGWNPSHDAQAVARSYRYGQQKPVYVYRLQTFGTWEDRIYKINIHKLALANRVVDKKNTVKAFTKMEMKTYFQPPPTSVPEWATDDNVGKFFASPDNEDNVLRAVIDKNKKSIASLVLQSELVRETVSDLSPADLFEVQNMVAQEHQRRIGGTSQKPQVATPNQPTTSTSGAMQHKVSMSSLLLPPPLPQQQFTPLSGQAPHQQSVTVQAQVQTTFRATALTPSDATWNQKWAPETQSHESRLEPTLENVAVNQGGMSSRQGNPTLPSFGSRMVASPQQPWGQRPLLNSRMNQINQAQTSQRQRFSAPMPLQPQAQSQASSAIATTTSMPWTQPTSKPVTTQQSITVPEESGVETFMTTLGFNDEAQDNQSVRRANRSDMEEESYEDAIAQHNAAHNVKQP